MTGHVGSRAWHWIFRASYRLIRWLDPLIRTAWRAAPFLLPRTVDLRVIGRRSARERSTLLTLLAVGDRRYVGHPNGPAHWARNLEAAGAATLVARGGPARPVRAIRLWGGPEREAVIRATWSQQPFPANVVYALARRHVREVGVFFRLLPVGDATPSGA